MSALPLVIDCDPGIDDALALMLALGHPDKLDLKAVTAVAGNVSLALTTANAARVLAMAKRSDIPVHAGCPRPLVKNRAVPAPVHGETGLDGAGLPKGLPPADAHAVNALIGLLEAAPAEGLTLCPIGPLTNIATVLVMRPDLARRISELVVMGGAIAGGNVTPVAEFNFNVDPHAAAVVFEARLPIVMVGLDVTETVRADLARIERMRAIGTHCAKAAADLLTFYGRGRSDGGAMHDPVALAWLLDQSLFTAKPALVTIVTQGLCAGQSVVDLNSATPNARVVTAADADVFFALLDAALARLP